MKGGKKMKRKVLQMMLLGIAIFGIMSKAYANESVYYTTPNGIELTEREYNFLTTFYWDNYVNIMTEEQYEEFANSDLLERELITSSSNENMCSPQGTSHTTPYKNLKISAACSSGNCSVSLVNTWLVNPSVRSYDVIGFFLNGPSLISYVTATVSNSTTTYYYNNVKTDYGSNYTGFGNSVLLPSGTNLIVNQVITTTTGGTIYGSYQHAVENVTLPVSKSYTFSIGGYGRVFSFYGNAVGKYDGMGGVEIIV